MYLQVLQAREQALGDKHPDIALSRLNLAKVYRETGRYAQAESAFRKVIEIRAAALGPDHLLVGEALVWFAQYEQERGRKRSAQQLYLRAARIIDARLGAQHPAAQDVARRARALAMP